MICLLITWKDVLVLKVLYGGLTHATTMKTIKSSPNKIYLNHADATQTHLHTWSASGWEEKPLSSYLHYIQSSGRCQQLHSSFLASQHTQLTHALTESAGCFFSLTPAEEDADWSSSIFVVGVWLTLDFQQTETLKITSYDITVLMCCSKFSIFSFSMFFYYSPHLKTINTNLIQENKNDDFYFIQFSCLSFIFWFLFSLCINISRHFLLKSIFQDLVNNNYVDPVL